MSRTQALPIRSCHPDPYIGYLVVCHVFPGICGGIWAIIGPLAIMASVDRRELAIVVAIYGIFGSTGQANGLAISASIWTNSMPKELGRYPSASAVYGELTKQMGFPTGTSICDGVVAAYGAV
jgi:hypothetical protein